MAERVIKMSDGLWAVCAKDAPPNAFGSLSYHDRRIDAVAWATTILSAAPDGGRWAVLDEEGREVESGHVSGRE